MNSKAEITIKYQLDGCAPSTFCTTVPQDKKDIDKLLNFLDGDDYRILFNTEHPLYYFYCILLFGLVHSRENNP